jgi:hypothetical protein
MRASGDVGRAGDGEGEGQSRVETMGYVSDGRWRKARGWEGRCRWLVLLPWRNAEHQQTPANRWPRQTKYVKHANACQSTMLPVTPNQFV